MSYLIFVDTNILLDFYRIRTREAGLSILRKLEQQRESIVTTDQVSMEFKKNRQRVLLETHRVFKAPDWASLTLPPLLTETKASRAIESHKKALTKHSTRLRQRLEKVLREPTVYDPVYQAFQRIYRHPSKFRLSREKKVRTEIRELAEKRFKLGYPPRKDADTSLGDAINWEWLINCAQNSTFGVVIVTRDSDYGAVVDGKPVLNDWLREEFRERVSRKRKIVLTDRVTEGLKHLSIAVTKQEEAAAGDLGAVSPPQHRIFHSSGSDVVAGLFGLSRSLPGGTLPLGFQGLLDITGEEPTGDGS